MKKALLVTVLVAFLALGTAFAEVTGVGDPEISGTMSLTAGWDFDYDASGFQNDNSITVKLPLLTGSETKGADDEIYGEIEIKDIGWYLQSDGGNFEFYDADEDADFSTASQYDEESGTGDDSSADAVDEMGNLDATMSATLHFYDFYVKLGNPDFKMNNVDISDDYFIDANAYVDDDDWSDGMAMGYANDMISFELKLASKDHAYMTAQDNDTGSSDIYVTPIWNDLDDYADDTYTANVTHSYVVGAALSVNPVEGVTLPMTFSYNKDYAGWASSFLTVGAAPSVKMNPIQFDLPIDYVMLTKLEETPISFLVKDGEGSLSALEMNPTLTYYLMEDGSNVALDVVYGAYFGTPEIYGETGDKAGNAIMDAGITLTETEENGFVPGLAASIGFTVVDLLDHKPWYATDAALNSEPVGESKAFGFDGAPTKWDLVTSASYNLGGIKPYVGYELDEAGTNDVNVGVELMAAATGIDNTTITLDYKNDDIIDNGGGMHDGEAGRLTLDVTVAW